MKVRYGGHQTFFIREGWLFKGVRLLKTAPEKLSDEFAADYLGVGRNMAMSINHWLLATGIAERTEKGQRKKATGIAPNGLADLLFERDPYFSELATWWVLHTNLVTNPDFAATWSWFFHYYLKDRFEKPAALEALKQWQSLEKGSQPSSSTLDRDLLVFLATYSRNVPPVHKDPEEEIDSPFRDLGLMTHFRSSGYYLLHRAPRSIPAGVLLYVLHKGLPSEALDGSVLDHSYSFGEIARWPLSPAKVFVTTNENLLQLFRDVETATARQAIRVQMLAGEPYVHFTVQSTPLETLRFWADSCWGARP